MYSKKEWSPINESSNLKFILKKMWENIVANDIQEVTL